MSRLTQRVLKKTGSTLTVTFYVNESATDPDGQAATVTITKDDGSVLVNAAAATRTDVGVFTYALAPQTNLDRLTVEWSATFSGVAQTISELVEIVGDFYVSLSEIRALDSLSDTTKFPTARLVEARASFEDYVERYTGRTFVKRYGRETISNTGARLLPTRTPISKVLWAKDVDGTTIDVSSVDVLDGSILYRSGGWGTTRQITVGYEYGAEMVPSDIREAALIAIRHRLLSARSPYPDRATTITSEAGTFALSTAAVDVIDVGFRTQRPTGIPEVDAILNTYKRPVFV